jgi:hypothetical protein
MSDYGGPRPEAVHDHAASPISVPWVVLAALCMGGGIFLIAYWLLTAFNWLWFSGFPLATIGGVMLLSRRAGLDA